MADIPTPISDAGGSKAEPTLQIGRYKSPVADSELHNFFSNIRDFLFERPINTKGMKATVFNTPGFGESLRDNLSEFFRSAPTGPVNSDLLINWNAGFSGFWQNLRDLISPPKLAPLKTTSQPVAVPELWSKNTQFTRVQALSLAVHVVILVLIIGPLLLVLPSPSTTKANSNRRDHHHFAVPAEAASGREESRRRWRWRRARSIACEPGQTSEICDDAVHSAQGSHKSKRAFGNDPDRFGAAGTEAAEPQYE